MPLDRIHCPLILSLNSVIATGYHENFTQVSSHTHNSLKHFPHFSLQRNFQHQKMPSRAVQGDGPLQH